MTYGELNTFCQAQRLYVHRNVIRDKALEITGIGRVSVIKTEMDLNSCCGYYLSPRNTEHQLIKQFGGHIIVLGRGMNKCWERFVYVKELMHIFDGDGQETRDGEQFETLLTEFSGPSLQKSLSTQYISEMECVWKALGALCPETERQRFQKERKANQIDDYGIALQLRIPEQKVHLLFKDYYFDLLNTLSG